MNSFLFVWAPKTTSKSGHPKDTNRRKRYERVPSQSNTNKVSSFIHRQKNSPVCKMWAFFIKKAICSVSKNVKTAKRQLRHLPQCRRQALQLSFFSIFRFIIQPTNQLASGDVLIEFTCKRRGPRAFPKMHFPVQKTS